MSFVAEIILNFDVCILEYLARSYELLILYISYMLYGSYFLYGLSMFACLL